MKKTWRTDEELNETVPDIPEDFEKWCVSKVRKAPVYYKRKGNMTECACGNCNGHYNLYTPRETGYEDMAAAYAVPVRNNETKCRMCGTETYYEWKRVIRPKFDKETFYLIQKTMSDDLVVRVFNLYQKIEQEEKIKNDIQEEQRHFLEMGRIQSMRRIWNWKEKTYYMKKGSGGSEVFNGQIYPGWQEEIKKSNLKYCDAMGMAERYGHAKGEVIGEQIKRALTAYANNPAIEMYDKSGMERLAGYLYNKDGISWYINRFGDTMEKQLRIKDKRKLKRLVKAEGNPDLMALMQYEEKNKMNLTEQQEEFVLRRPWMQERVLDLLEYMSFQQMENRVKKYKEQGGDKYKDEYSVIFEYADYLAMRKELGYDMKNEVFLHPKDLHERHQEMVEEKNERRDELYIARKSKEYPKIAEKYEKLCEKYQANIKGYVIRPAKDAEEIIKEGRELHHCVGRDEYLKLHNKGKSIILLLRKEKSTDKPYITIEISDKRIVQWYGMHDRKTNRDVIEKVLREYVDQLKNKEKKSKQQGVNKSLKNAV